MSPVDVRGFLLGGYFGKSYNSQDAETGGRYIPVGCLKLARTGVFRILALYLDSYEICRRGNYTHCCR